MYTKIKMSNHNNYNHHNLFEGLEQDDLIRLVHPKCHIDEFRSKMGEDADIMVLSFKVKDKNPASDLMNFIERGYEWVLDADVSTGELDDGDYLVFVELERTPAAAKYIEQLIEDILNLTGQKISDWSLQYQKNSQEFPVKSDLISKFVPLTADSYIARFGEEDIDTDKDLEKLQETARISVNKKAPVNDFTESLRVAAGLK